MVDYRSVGSSGEKTDVVILTPSYKISGSVALTPGARLTDFVTTADSFIAVTDAKVRNHHGDLILTASFIDVNRDHVELIAPAETTTAD